MKNKLKFTAFMAIGIFSLSSLAIMLGQGGLYKDINKQVDKFESLIISNHEDQQIENWVNEDVNFVKNLQSSNKEYKNTLNMLHVDVIKSYTVLDKISVPILKLAKLISSSENEDEYKRKLEIMQGTTSYLAFAGNTNGINESGMSVNQDNYELVIGAKSFESTKEKFFVELKKVFEGNQQMMVDFVVFHEMGHYLSTTLEGKESAKQLELEKSLIENFETKINRKLSNSMKDIILDQYAESIGDLIGVQLMLVKYPELINDLNFIGKLEILRSENINIKNLGHLTSAGLEVFRQDVEINGFNKNKTVEDMLETARSGGIKNVEYFSGVTSMTKENKKPNRIMLSENGMNDIEVRKIQNSIAKMRQKYQNETENSQNKLNK